MTRPAWLSRSRTSAPNWDQWSRLLFVLALVGAAFIVGIGVGARRWFPYDVIQSWRQDLISFRRHWRSDLGIEPTRHLRTARHDGSGVTVWRQDTAQPGLTLIVGLIDAEVGLQLVSMSGDVVHRWHVSFSAVWPDPQHLAHDEIPTNDVSLTIQGAVLLPDGAAVFNYGNLGMAKVDVNDSVVWRLPERTHHLIDLAEDGSFWTLNRPPAGRSRERPRPISPVWWHEPAIEESLLHVSPDGEVLDEIPILDALYLAGLEGLVYNNEVALHAGLADVTHLNDVEILRRGDAEAFPALEAGDLLVSARNLNLILVLDPRTRRIRWHHTGPWIEQHDPDFASDGSITVFDNRRDLTAAGSALGGSRIVVLDQTTLEWRVAYGGSTDQHFYTEMRGTHQLLDNGNWLITESDAGRAFEVTADGDLAWEYVNRHDADEVAILMQAARYPADYFDIDEWRSAR